MNHLRIMILMLLIIIVLSWIVPIKIAVKLDGNKILNKFNSGEYIVMLCSREQVTGGDWRIKSVLHEGINKSTKRVNNYIDIVGNFPLHESYDKWVTSDFIFIGEFIADKDKSGELVSVFSVKDWEVVYPVMRNTILPGAKSYLNIYDFNFSDIIKGLVK